MNDSEATASTESRSVHSDISTNSSVELGAARTQYILVALLFFGTALAYFDRQTLALLKPTLDALFHWTDADFAFMGAAFSFASAATILFSGWLVDKVGVRRSYGVAVFLWSIAGTITAFASTVQQFVGARVLLAVTETVSGPASIKAAAEYLPPQQRSVAIGIVTSATSIGAIAAPLVIPTISVAFGWQAAFLCTGGVGFVWLTVWLWSTRNFGSVGDRTTASRGPEIRWRLLLTDRRTWAVVGAKIISDWVFWFTLFWMPAFFHSVFHLAQAQLGEPIALIYTLAALGAVGAGVAFPALIKRGVNSHRARQVSLVVFACFALPYAFVLGASSPWVAATIIGIAVFGHNGFTTNIFGMIADVVPRPYVATVMALSSVASNLSGAVMIEVSGWCLTHGYGYRPMFIMGSVAYLLAFAWIHVLLPVIRPASA